MTARWETKPLKDVCIFLNGLWKGEKPPFTHVGVIRNTNFTKEGILNYSDTAYLDVETKQFQSRKLQFGDVILEKSGGGPKQAVGRVALFDRASDAFSFSNFTSAVRVIDQSRLSFRFLHKFLHWVYISGATESLQTNSTGIRNLNGDAYKQIQIPVPPLPEQQRIVRILDEAFESIAIAKANTEKNLQNARALFDAHLKSVFEKGKGHWATKTLGDVAEIQSGGTPSISRQEFWSGDIPWYSSGELNTLATGAPERNITIAGLQNSNAKVFPKGSLLIGMYDTAALKMSVLDRDAAFNQAIAGVKPSSELRTEFLFHAINVKKPVLLLERRGVRQKNLSLSKIKEIALALPSPHEQDAIVSSLRAFGFETKNLQGIYRQKLTALESLKKSLLHQAFSGAL